MIDVCTQWVKDRLSVAGVKAFDGLEAWSQTQPLPFACVVIERERLARDGSRVARKDAANGRSRQWRRRVWERESPVTVRLAHQTVAAANTVVVALLLAAAGGVDDGDGNWVRVACDGVEWEQSKATTPTRVNVEIALVFKGGVYADSTVPLARGIQVEPLS